MTFSITLLNIDRVDIGKQFRGKEHFEHFYALAVHCVPAIWENATGIENQVHMK